MQDVSHFAEPGLLPQPGHPLDRINEILLIGLLVYLPMAFGGVLPLSHLVLVVVAAVMAAGLALRCFLAPSSPVVWTWAFLPAALFLGLVAFQLLPLTGGLLARLAPETARIWGELSVAGGESERVPLSLYPQATREDLRLLLAGGMISFVVVHLCRDRAALGRILGAAALIGVGVAALAVLQVATDATEIYWSIETPVDRARGGPFVHHGHFSEFVNLTMGCALALLFVRASERRGGRTLELEDVLSSETGGATRWDRFLAFLPLLGVVAVGLSTSRNGMISMVFAGVVIGALLHGRGFLVGIGWPFIGLLFAGFVALLLLGFDPVYERLATLEDPVASLTGRLDLLRDTIDMVASFPLFGAGLGTFRVVFPMFDQSMRASTAAHAENLYAEALAETGIVGVALLALLGLAVFLAWFRVLRRPRSPLAGVAFGGGFGLLAVAFHMGTDFGVKTPAVGILFGVLAATMLGLGARRTSSRGGARAVCAAVSLAGCGLLVAMIPDAHSAWRAERCWRRVEALQEELLPKQYCGTEEQFTRLLANARAARELQPDDIRYRYWEAVHTWQAALAEATGYAGPDESATIVRTPELIAIATQTRDRLLEARRVCPTHGPLWSIAGQIGVQWVDDPEAARWIHRGRELAPHHPATCLASGVQFLLEGNDAASLAALHRAVRMGADPVMVMATLLDDLGRVDLAHEVARGRVIWRVWLERRLASRPEEAERAAEIRVEVREILTTLCERGDAETWMYSKLARLHVLAGDDAAAIPLYLTYLTYVPDSRVRYDLARCLADSGRIDEARRQLTDMLSIHPDHAASRTLLDGLGE
jgi:O-antigen ligase